MTNDGTALPHQHEMVTGWGVVPALVCVAAVIVSIASWCVTPAAFVAEDSFFYLVVADNLATGHGQTFNRLFPTNGFHPLWLYLLSAYAWVLGLFDVYLTQSLSLAVPLSAACFSLGLAQLWRVARSLGSNPLLTTFPPLLLLGLGGVLYSEAHLHFLLLTRLCWCLAPEKRCKLTVVELASVVTLLTLSRLDSVFVAVAALVHLAVAGQRHLAARAAACAAVLLAPYLLSNVIWFGGLTPISGYVKSTFPSPEFLGLSGVGTSLSLSGYSVLRGAIPLLLVASSYRIWRGLTERTLLSTLLAGASVNAVYIMFFTWGFTSWHWYYVVPVTLLGLWSGAVVRYLTKARPALQRAVGPVCLALPFLVAVGHTRVEPEFAGSSQRTVEYFLSRPNAVVLAGEFPGRVAYFTRARVIPADMLMGNRRLYHRLINSQNACDELQQVLVERGERLSHVVINGGHWLRSDGRTVHYFDPRDPKSQTRAIGSCEKLPTPWQHELGSPTVFQLSPVGQTQNER